jgi:pimeloyl-ACP methyl ester carboxylesterase
MRASGMPVYERGTDGHSVVRPLLLHCTILFLLISELSGAACADNYKSEIPTWTKVGMFSGASVTNKDCRTDNHVWVTDGEAGFCIRFFTNDVAPKDGYAVLFFHGDFVGSDWDRSGMPIRPRYSMDIEGPALFRHWHILSQALTKVPLILLSRPGTAGSSGDQGKMKYRAQESRVMSAAIDQIKLRFGLKTVILVGQSGGATLVANILPKRSDVTCAVMASGAIALWHFASDQRFATVIWTSWEDPLYAVKKQEKEDAEIYVLAGEGDTIREPKYQKEYADALIKKGFLAHYLLLHVNGNPHFLDSTALHVGEACALKEPFDQIKHSLRVVSSDRSLAEAYIRNGLGSGIRS